MAKHKKTPDPDPSPSAPPLPPPEWTPAQVAARAAWAPRPDDPPRELSLDMIGMEDPPPRVICRVCKAKILEVNLEDGYLDDRDDRGFRKTNYQVRRFDPDRAANGAMFHLAPTTGYRYPYKPSSVYKFGLLTCPKCSGPLCNSSGRVKLDRPMPPPKKYFGNGIVHPPAVTWEDSGG